jgi:hypothetical protein
MNNKSVANFIMQMKFYKDFLEKAKNNPGKESSSRYFAQRGLLQGLQEITKSESFPKDLFQKDINFIKEQMSNTDKALARLGISFR